MSPLQGLGLGMRLGLHGRRRNPDGGGGDPGDLSQIEIEQYEGARPPLSGGFVLTGQVYEYPEVHIVRPAAALALTAGTVIGDPVDARIEFANAARLAGGMTTFILSRWNYMDNAGVNGMALLLFRDQIATVRGDGQQLALSDTDTDNIIGLAPFGLGGDRLWQNNTTAGRLDSASGVSTGSNQTDMILTGTSLWAYLIATGAWTVAASFDVRMKPWVRYRS